MSERALNATLKTSLTNEDPFLYAHLIKFERAVSTEESTPSKNARDYVYISDASYDIIFDDESKNVQGVANGSQIYRANRVGKISTIAETTEAKANSLTLEINSTLLGATSPAAANIAITYAGTSIGSTVTLNITGTEMEGWAESGFLIGDKICIKKSGHTFHNNRAVITAISANGMLLTCEALDAGSTTNSITSDFVVENAADEYQSLFYEEYEGTAENGAYAGYINREVFIYKAHIDPDTGKVIGMNDSTKKDGPYLIFKGIIAKAKITEDPNKTSKMSWSLTSHWGDFVRVNGRLTADSEHRALAGNGQVDVAALNRFEYGSDLGFMHSERAINMISVYKATETRTRLKTSGWLFKKYSQEEYTVQVDREVDLRFNLEAKYLPVIYGVQRTDSIPIFADTLKKDSSEIFCVYAICEGEVGGIYDIYIDDQSRICTDKNDNETRGNAANTVEVPCEGRMDRGDTLSSTPASHLGDAYTKYVFQDGQYSAPSAAGFVPTMSIFRNFRPAQNTNDNPINDAGGVTHEMKTQMQSPIDAEFIVHSGRKHQRADDLLVSIADKTQESSAGVLNEGFKLQEGSENENNYWGPQHRLLDTVYAVAKYKVSEGETEIPSVDFVVRGREIEQYNYDYSYEQHPNPVYATGKNGTTQEAYFNIGDVVDSYDPLDSNAVLATNITIMDKQIYKNARVEEITKFRFSSDPSGGKKVFNIVKDGIAATSNDKLTFATWDFKNNSGDLAGLLELTVGTDTSQHAVIGSTGTDGGIDLFIPASTNGQRIRDILTYAAPDGAVLIAFFSATSTPATINIEKSLAYFQVSDYDTSTNKIKNINNNRANLPVAGDKLIIVNAARLPLSASSVNGYYKGQEVRVTRTLTDGSIESQSQKIIKYHGGSRTALFGDISQASIEDAEVFVDLGTNNFIKGVPGANEGTVITYAGTGATAALTAIKASLDAGNTIVPTDFSTYFPTHGVESGTRIADNGVDVTNLKITYNRSITANPLAKMRHKVIQSSSNESYQPGIGEFIPNTGNSYSIVSRGDKKVSINPAIQLLDYLTDARYGRGLSIDDDINLSTFLDAARKCDTRSNITIQTQNSNNANTFVIGDVYEYKVTQNDGAEKVFWRGTVLSVQDTSGQAGASRMVTFGNCIGKLVTKHEDWKVYEEGQLIWKKHIPATNTVNFRHVTHKVPYFSDSSDYNIGVSLSAQQHPLSAGLSSYYQTLENVFPLSKVSGSGPTTMNARASTAISANASADGNPFIKGYDSVSDTMNDSGYSLYDSDEVKYWRYMGWQSQSQSEVTRHQTNAVIRTETPVFDNVNGMLKHFNGVLRFSDGKYDLAVEQALEDNWASDDIRKITEDDIIGAISLDDAGLKGSANSVSVSIPDPAIRYDNRSITFFNSDYLKQDRGIPKKKDIKTPQISNYFNARMNAEQYLIQSRSNKKINFKVGPKGVLLLAGELIKVTYPRFGFNEKVFRISNLSFTPDCLTQITAIEHDDKSYKIGAKRANAVINDGQGTGDSPVPEVVAPAPPSALTATAGVEQVTLNWTNSAFAGENWETELLRNTSNNIPTEVLQTFSKTKTTHVDTEVTGGITYYYWVRHARNYVTRQGRTLKVRSVTFPSSDGRSAAVVASQNKQRAQAILYYNSTIATAALFASSNSGALLPANISGFPDITYNFTTQAISGVSSGSITNDQIGSTGWFRKPQPQTSGQSTFAIIAVAEAASEEDTTDILGKAEWLASSLYIAVPSVDDSISVSSSGTNLEHTFIMSDAGVVSNDYTCAFNVNRGDQAYTYANSGTGANTFGINVLSTTGGVTFGTASVQGDGSILFGQVKIGATGIVTILNASSIIANSTVEEASIVVELFDRGNSNTDIVKYTINLRKESRSSRDGVTLTLLMTAAEAAAFKGTLTNTVAEAVKAAVIASSLTRICTATNTKRIVPNDRITVKNVTGGTTIVSQRVYIGTAKGAADAAGQASDFSSVVSDEFDGSVIVNGTLSAETLAADTTISNQVNVGSILKLGTSNSDSNAKFFSHAKTSFTDTTAGIFMDGSGRINIGDNTNFMKFDGSNFAFQGQFSVTGATGAAGSKTIFLFRKNSNSDKPTSQGTFADPRAGFSSAQQNWVYDIPSLTSNNDVIYVISRTFASSGTSPNWSAASVYAQRTDGAQGTSVTGPAGAAGAAFYTIFYTGTGTANNDALCEKNKIAEVIGRFAVVGDVCIVKTANTTTPSAGFKCTGAQSASSNGTWQTAAVFISGDLIVSNTIGADKIVADSISSRELQISSTSGNERVEFTSTNINIYNGGILRVKIGQL